MCYHLLEIKSLEVYFMNKIKILENALEKLDTDLESVDLPNCENYPIIKKYVEDYHVKNSSVVNKYLEEVGLNNLYEPHELMLEDILYIIAGQISEIQNIIKKQLSVEYSKALKENELMYDSRK